MFKCVTYYIFGTNKKVFSSVCAQCPKKYIILYINGVIQDLSSPAQCYFRKASLLVKV